MSRYINPFTDFGFKRIFGDEANTDILIDFLNSLEFHPVPIKKIHFKKTEKLGFSVKDRKAIFDLYCHDTRGNRFIVELQRVEQEFFKDRALYYSTYAIQEQSEKKEWDYKLSGVYFVGILDFELRGEKEKKGKYIHSVVLMEKETKEVFYDKLEFKFVEVPKFNKTEEQLKTILDKWIYFFKYLHTLEDIPETLNNEMFIKAFGIAETTNLNKEKRLEYEASLKAYRDLTVVLNESFDKGKVEGIEKGKIESLKNKIIILLEKKLNKIPDNIIEKIKNCSDISKLDNILDNIFDINSFDEVEKILESP